MNNIYYTHIMVEKHGQKVIYSKKRVLTAMILLTLIMCMFLIAVTVQLPQLTDICF